ncbi:helix-turn-helix domain-containing protein [Zobellia uliginosa]|uniref:helix-turn-helix domain-containing protein n=1 Tax=Zobellia uliginosa TaxID=143224 RepID=UPI00208FFBC2|nr:helix-turn-helix domain-containing protein [Zobellia uliginosa]
MNTIPNITFESSEGATDIEFLSLAEMFSRIKKDPNHNPKQPHRISFFALLIITEGEGEHQVDLTHYSVRKGCVIKIAKGQVHAFQENPNYKGYLVVFTEDFVLRYFSKSSIKVISHLYNYHISSPLVENSTFNDFFLEQLNSELHRENSYAQKEIVAKILELYLLRLERHAHIAPIKNYNKQHQTIFMNFKDLVEKNYTNTRNVKDYADMLFVSTKHLNLVVKEFTFTTAKNFIDNFVILETKRAIVSTDKSLKEIGFAVGFDEVTNFTKFFKKHIGTTPKEFKAAI